MNGRTVTVNVAQSEEEAEMQKKLGHAIIPSESGRDDDEPPVVSLFAQEPVEEDDESVSGAADGNEEQVPE